MKPVLIGSLQALPHFRKDLRVAVSMVSSEEALAHTLRHIQATRGRVPHLVVLLGYHSWVGLMGNQKEHPPF